MHDFQQVLNLYGIKGAIDEVAPFGLGHINNTFKILSSEGNFILQEINTNVFTRVDIIETNIDALLKLNSPLFVRHFKSELGYHLQQGGSIWRLTEFQERTYAPVNVSFEESLEVVKGFGQFTGLNANLNVNDFEESIKDFQSLELRLNQLKEAIENDSVSRLITCPDLVESALNKAWILDAYESLSNSLPMRVCHNDTKAANALLKSSDQSFSKIIDLDTLGPGYVFYDFGDMMRSMLASHPENEPDIEKLSVLENRFEKMYQTFIDHSGGVITQKEIESLPFGGHFITYITAIRFLADYLNGDVYYKTSSREENYLRARNQLHLLDQLEAIFHFNS